MHAVITRWSARRMGFACITNQPTHRMELCSATFMTEARR